MVSCFITVSLRIRLRMSDMMVEECSTLCQKAKVYFYNLMVSRLLKFEPTSCTGVYYLWDWNQFVHLLFYCPANIGIAAANLGSTNKALHFDAWKSPLLKKITFWNLVRKLKISKRRKTRLSIRDFWVYLLFLKVTQYLRWGLGFRLHFAYRLLPPCLRLHPSSRQVLVFLMWKLTTYSRLVLWTLMTKKCGH